jgi:DUF971 family protein
LSYRTVYRLAKGGCDILKSERKELSMTAENRHWPKELKVARDRRLLTVLFEDGVELAIPAELLRVASPSAEVQGHSPEQRITVAGKREVEILELLPVGSYAVRIVFDDLHDTGIFTWAYLRELGEQREERMQAYLAELEEKGLSREKGSSNR